MGIDIGGSLYICVAHKVTSDVDRNAGFLKACTILQAGVGALSSVLADQWREYFYCDSMPVNVLVKKGTKRLSSKSSNTHSSDNIITNGSIIAVNEGQCMMIVDQGAIVELCAEAGEFVWDSSTEPTIFYGGLERELKNSWDTLRKRFAMGGDTGKDQRIYFFNTKEIIGNKYGTANPVPFRVVDQNIGLDMDIAIKFFGEYSYRISNPMLFYKNVCGNVEDDYTRSKIDSQLKSALTAIQPAIAKISAMGIRYSALPGHTTELAQALNEVLSEKWSNLRGMYVVSFGVSSMSANEDDEETIKELQKNAVFRNPNMAAAHLVGAQADAMKSAAANEGAGAFMAFAGMNMAQGTGGMNAQNLFNMDAVQQPVQQQASKPQGTASWTCPRCGTVNMGRFCMECAAPKPQAAAGWTCSHCGTLNKGKFCTECAAPKPKGVPQYKCDKCGWEPADMSNPPKFCPECGDPFDDGDIR